tara:strand:- start:85 stop:486 length:402 start_codon:yes stop_codon:yes gene_type:complete
MPFCRFCDNKKMPSDKHWMFVNGVATCPELLSIECNYCHEKGHTPKYCPILKEKNKPIVKAVVVNPVIAVPIKKKKVKKETNIWKMFQQDSDEEEEPKVTFIVEEPVVLSKKKDSLLIKNNCWAAEMDSDNED